MLEFIFDQDRYIWEVLMSYMYWGISVVLFSSIINLVNFLEAGCPIACSSIDPLQASGTWLGRRSVMGNCLTGQTFNWKILLLPRMYAACLLCSIRKGSRTSPLVLQPSLMKLEFRWGNSLNMGSGVFGWHSRPASLDSCSFLVAKLR